MTQKETLPCNDADTLYIRTYSFQDTTIGEILEQAREHFGDIEINDLNIQSEYIHIRCLNHDQFDGADWANYLVITRWA
jgi:hypothetical protein